MSPTRFILKIREMFEMRPSSPPTERGYRWIWHDGRWHEVCDFCGGNCGQCGNTSRLGCGIPASMEVMARNLGADR